MFNIFEANKIYKPKFQELERRNLTAEELALAESAKVVESNYGLSVEIAMKNGAGTIYIPLSIDSKGKLGDIVDVTKLIIVLIQRPGEEIKNRAFIE